MKAWALVSCGVVNVYLLGVMVMFAAVTYPLLGAVERSAFPSAYAAFTSRIGAPVVLFEFLALLVTVPLYWWRPETMPTWSVHALLALAVAYFAITFGWHLPSHRALASGDNSVTAMAPLLMSQWARTVVQGLRVGALAWATARAMLDV